MAEWLDVCLFFFFKQKTAYEMRISDWSSDVCSADLDGDGVLAALEGDQVAGLGAHQRAAERRGKGDAAGGGIGLVMADAGHRARRAVQRIADAAADAGHAVIRGPPHFGPEIGRAHV